MIINKPGHMTKMATMPVYGKNPSKIFFAGNVESIAMKLDIKQLRLEYYYVYVNHDPLMTMTDFTAMSLYAENC